MKVLISGCGSGFGRGLAVALLRRGAHVIATEPDVTGLEADLRGAAGDVGTLEVHPLDVARSEQVRAVAVAAGAVDVLVNNAGYAFFGTLEEGSSEAFARLLDVNVVGVHRLTRAMLPGLRERGGVVVMVSSIAGRTVFPESGFYAATKYAVEAMAEALFQETCSFGVRIRLVEPGSFDTNFLPTAMALSVARTPDSPYAPLRETWDARKVSVLEAPQDPTLVVDAILASLEDDRPFLRVPVGLDAARILAVRDALSPDGWVRLAAARLGCDPGHEPGDVLPPGQALVAPVDDLGPTLVAWRAGHLDHWADLPRGPEALRRLAQLAVDP